MLTAREFYELTVQAFKGSGISGTMEPEQETEQPSTEFEVVFTTAYKEEEGSPAGEGTTRLPNMPPSTEDRNRHLP